MSNIPELYKDIKPNSVRVEISSYNVINSINVRTSKIKLFANMFKNIEINGFKDKANNTIFLQFPFVSVEAQSIFIEIFYRKKGKGGIHERNISETMNLLKSEEDILNQIINLREFFEFVSQKSKKKK